MINWIKQNWGDLLTIFCIWFAIGALIGAFDTFSSRNASKQENGCVYYSVAAYTNPGYLLVCEAFRVRFEHHGLLNSCKQVKE